MAGPTTRSLSEDLKDLWGEVSNFRLEFSAFRARVEVQLALIKWVGVFFSGILLASFVGTAQLAWNASAMNSEVTQQGKRIAVQSSEFMQQGKRFEALSSELVQQGTRIEALSSEFMQQGKRFEALNSEVAQQGTRIETLKTNSEATIQQLDRIERRLESLAATLVPDDPPEEDRRPGG